MQTLLIRRNLYTGCKAGMLRVEEQENWEDAVKQVSAMEQCKQASCTKVGVCMRQGPTARISLQVEEQKRRAEADKLAAITALEQRSREFMREKEEKRRLETRIANMQSQLLIGGSKLEDTPVFRCPTHPPNSYANFALPLLALQPWRFKMLSSQVFALLLQCRGPS